MEDLIIGSFPLLISIIVAFIFYKQLEPKWLRLFPWFLVATFLIQFAGYAYSHFLKKSNHFIFNLYMYLEYGFYIFVLYKGAKKKTGRIILGLLIAFTIFFIVKVIMIDDFFVYNPVAKNVGELISFCCCLLYFIDLLLSGEVINYFTLPMFWFTTGIMLAAVGDFVYLSLFDYLIKNIDPEGKLYGIIMTTLSFLEYGLFTIGFACKKIWTKAR